MTGPLYFQWQNEILCKDIYPMRKEKLRDFLIYYQEIDLWKEYKDKDISGQIKQYQDAQRLAAITTFKTYTTKRDYFMRADARSDYLKFRPIDEAELTEINNFHNIFISYWPKDVRGERDFITTRIMEWEQKRKWIVEDIKSKERRHAAMDPKHEKYESEGKALEAKKTITLPMADQELDQLYALRDAYEKVEARKLEWYQKKRKDPTFSIPEADFLIQVPSDKPPTPREIVGWQIEEYEAKLANKNQFELLDEIHQRFLKEPKRYPLWLQYMVVHFSGMRYHTAHSTWADPKDLVIRLRRPGVEKTVDEMDLATLEKTCKEKITAYESPNGAKPKLAQTQDQEVKSLLAGALASVKSNGPSYRRDGLKKLLVLEMADEIRSWTTAQALEEIKKKKAMFPAFAWKIIVKLTPLRVTEVTAPGWEALTPAEQAEGYLPQNGAINKLIYDWANYDVTGWREEHGRSHELIVASAVCNEAAEHIQHLRGHLPPGGLSPKPGWYLKNETENTVPGNPRPYYVKPTRATLATDYTPGASILWLRFVDKAPDSSQIAKPIATKNHDGLLPTNFINRPPANNNMSNWVYRQGPAVTRIRSFVNEKKQKVNQTQWLRWFHEATVAEVAENADGPVIITFETARPDDPRGTSCVGIFRNSLNDWYLSDGPNEDGFNRSFVGFVPEGQVPVEHLKEMLDWNKILLKQFA